MATGLTERFILAEDAAVKRKFEGLQVSYPKPRDVDVWYRWPNKETRDITYPFIAVDLVDILKADHREHQGGRMILEYEPHGYEPDFDMATGIASSGDWPTPYDLIYTVTVVTRDPRHERELLVRFLGDLALAPHRWGFLEIPEDETVRRFETLSIRDLTGRNSSNDTEYRRVFTIRVESELFTSWVEDVMRAGLLTLVLSDRNSDLREEYPTDLTILPD